MMSRLLLDIELNTRDHKFYHIAEILGSGVGNMLMDGMTANAPFSRIFNTHNRN